MAYPSFPKIHRLSREMIVTEKLDGTNGLISIIPSAPIIDVTQSLPIAISLDGLLAMYVGSRSRWITPEKGEDNFGFAAWVKDNADDLFNLGIGDHYGEWWGQGIQRNYGLKEKRFSLFNVSRWSDDEVRPKCCHVVPVLMRQPHFSTGDIEISFSRLRHLGSKAAPGFMKPEGVVVFHTASGYLFKKTIEKDEGKE